jgi:hypothetical protein
MDDDRVHLDVSDGPRYLGEAAAATSLSQGAVTRTTQGRVSVAPTIPNDLDRCAIQRRNKDATDIGTRVALRCLDARWSRPPQLLPWRP